MSEHGRKAKELFLEGYNCAQAVVLAFAEEYGMTREMAAKLASSLGGGVGGMRDICGAVSGMALAAGLICGYDDPGATTEKAEHYARIQEMAARFREKRGTLLCRDLLELGENPKLVPPKARTAEYYAKRPCGDLVELAAGILESYLCEHHL